MRSRPLLLGGLLGAASVAFTAVATEATDPLRSVTGRFVVAISDGDFQVASYRDGSLPAASRGLRDTLTVLPLGTDRRPGQLTVSNAVTATPDVLDLSPDGRFAFVAEMHGERPPDAVHRRDLPPGRRIFSIDLSDPSRPRLHDTATVGPEPIGLKVSPDGGHVALASIGGGRAAIEIVPVRDGRFARPQSFALDELGVRPREGQPRGGLDVSLVDWHPSGRAVSATLFLQDRVAFFRIDHRPDGTVTLLPWGAPVEVGRDPFVGRFLPDGRHFVSADWGRDFAATTVDGRLPAVPSTLTLVRLDDDGRHEVVQRIATDRSSEGLAISRDGRLVATVNMRETALEPGHPRHVAEATVSLFRFDPAGGRLTKLGDTPFAGLLPEGAAFDRAGRHLLVSVFEYAEPGAPAAGLEVFEVVESGTGLRRIGRVPLPHGAHHVAVAP
jgi:6-phosphogluconolactonase (cycloisomerase 2 family)